MTKQVFKLVRSLLLFPYTGLRKGKRISKASLIYSLSKQATLRVYQFKTLRLSRVYKHCELACFWKQSKD